MLIFSEYVCGGTTLSLNHEHQIKSVRMSGSPFSNPRKLAGKCLVKRLEAEFA
jgi:hypothetical protein